jgi:Uma2 family endonuclease
LARGSSGSLTSVIECLIWRFIELSTWTVSAHYVWSAPELIIECLSPANRKGSVDQLLQDYASIQVPEVWLLYPEERMLRRWALETDGYRQAPTDIATASPLRLSTVRIDVNEIWKLLPAGS